MQTKLQEVNEENMKIKIDQEKKLSQMKDTIEINLIKVSRSKLEKVEEEHRKEIEKLQKMNQTLREKIKKLSST